MCAEQKYICKYKIINICFTFKCEYSGIGSEWTAQAGGMEKPNPAVWSFNPWKETFPFTSVAIGCGPFTLSNGASITIYIYELHGGNVKLFFRITLTIVNDEYKWQRLPFPLSLNSLITSFYVETRPSTRCNGGCCWLISMLHWLGNYEKKMMHSFLDQLFAFRH